ncbi:galactoside O-acetyltransferase [Sphingomonas kaistensis]|uniref:Galactoside O-acetyltransferase n=1 Tax=Sphingomonas kaistensis TaxID=298708 RepID=A0A7X6BGQ9_9SPHN|nr:acyltransferase [Sphingomonas kaistensis]NJC06113.1 galactoside O-acetyltransferase [Sphingomonas kaistensis]
MPFLSQLELEALGFRHLGQGVRISDKASLYNCELISIGDYSRIDDFCVVSGKVTIGRNVHVAVFCNVAGGTEGVTIMDFAGLAYGCHVFSQSDDYSGRTMTNPTVPNRFKNETRKAVLIDRHSIVGTSSIILPGVTLAEGTAVGAASMVTKSTEPWMIYSGVPARRLKSRRRDLLDLEHQFISGTD